MPAHRENHSHTQRRTSPDTKVPWSGFDLINRFNGWKKTEAAGRTIAVDGGGVAEVRVAGLSWRGEVCQQVFEEAAVDLGRALSAWSDSRAGTRKGKRVEFPRFKKKARATPSFRLRNKHTKGRPPAIRVGDHQRPRSVTLPGIGPIAVHDDTRRLRRMLATGRAKILFATITGRAGRWWVSLNVEAADLHPAHHHTPRNEGDAGGWVGVDRGLSAFLVAATSDGEGVARITEAPKALAAGMKKQRRLAKSLSRTQKGSRNRRDAAKKLGRHHHHVANVRRHFLHQVANALVKTHDRLVVEDLNVSRMLHNHRLAQAIADAGWTEFARIVGCKHTPRPTSPPGAKPITMIHPAIPGPPSNGAGRPTPADGTALTSTPRVLVKPARMTREPTVTPHPRPEPTDARERRCQPHKWETRFSPTWV
jgi:putative transposase